MPEKAGIFIRRAFTEAGLRAATKLGVSFSMKNVHTAAAATQQVGHLVTEVTMQTQKAIASIIHRAVTEGISVPKSAKMIRPLIGLTDRQAMAVMNAQSSWEAAGLSGEVAQRKAEAYAAKLLRQRAKTIAQTKIRAASSAGQLTAWRNARDAGLIGANAEREWIASPGACEICGDLEGTTAGLEEDFANGVEAPPAHPRCRCTTGLSFTKPAERVKELV